MNDTCRICGQSGGHAPRQLAERMLGLGDSFPYFQCGQCGCLQIQQSPPDWTRYYPPHYYSFNVDPVPQQGWKAWLAGRRDAACITRSGMLGRVLALLQPSRLDIASLRFLSLCPQDRLLDVGCGRGQLLSALARAGFTKLSGVDPFLATDLEVIPGVWVQRRYLAEVEGHYDCIMLHHVLEHIEDQLGTLAECRERLAPGGRILLRIPTIECEAMERDGTYAVHLDAPRHLVIHTRGSFRRLAARAGLRVQRLLDDSYSLQFWGSELYRKGLPLITPEGRQVDPLAHFSRQSLRAFERKAWELNRNGRGDQFLAVLVPEYAPQSS